MTRPNIAHSTAGICTNSTYYGNNPQTAVGVARTVSETYTGVTRHKPRGFIPPTNYTMRFLDYRSAQGVCALFKAGVPPSFGSRYVGNVGGTGGRFNSANHYNDCVSESTAIADPGVVNTSLIKARVKMKGGSVNLGVAFAERNRTAGLVADTASNIAKSLRALRRGEVRGAMRHLGISGRKREPRGANVPQKWLELQYGWKPLLSDIYGSCDALARRNKEDWRVTAKGRSRMTKSWSRSIVPTPTSGFDASTCVCTVQYGAMTRIDALPSNELLISLSSLGVTNPLLVGWELVPFSFVFDWFLPVGEFLDSLDAMLGYGSAYTSTSFWREAKWVDTGVSKNHANGWRTENSFVGTKEVRKLDRTASSGVPLPSFPRIKDPRSLTHMANGLSLLAGFFGRQPVRYLR